MASLNRVCVSSWSFHTFFEKDPNDPAKVLMDVLDFPEMVADRYGVHNARPVPAGRRPRAREAARGQDFGRCMRIAMESGFKGVFSVEAGGREDPHVEVQKIVDALVDNL